LTALEGRSLLLPARMRKMLELSGLSSLFCAIFCL
jgi:hypothetical protein